MSSLSLRAGLVLVSTLLSLLAAEALLRLADGGALPQPPLYEAEGAAGIQLQAGREANALLALRHRYTVTTGQHGLRAASTDWRWTQPAWLVLGDSQALGLGVDHEQTFAARASADGLPMVSAGVPSYGLQDALTRGHELLGVLDPAPLGVVVLVNQANDWDEVDRPVASSFEVAGGWLLPRKRTAAWQRAFFRSSLSHLHLPHIAVTLLSRAGAGMADLRPLWARDAVATKGATAELAAALRAFDTHATVPVVVVYMPLDIVVSVDRVSQSPFGRVLETQRPWEDRGLIQDLRQELGDVRLLDLTPSLGAGDFLDGDYHLSPSGHRTVATALGRELGQAPPAE